MIWLGAVVLLLLALTPAALALRSQVRVQGRRDTAMALHRAQVAELSRDLGEGRISASDHATALLEVQRRLLAAAETDDTPARAPDRGPLLLGLALVPMAALGLYLVGGRPDVPAQPLAGRMRADEKRLADEGVMAGQLRAALAGIDPQSDKARQGQMMLGNLEADQGRFAEAAEAWRAALAIKFDPLLAAQVADAASRAEGRVSPASAALFRQALAGAPADAPWRGEVEQRLAEGVR